MVQATIVSGDVIKTDYLEQMVYICYTHVILVITTPKQCKFSHHCIDVVRFIGDDRNTDMISVRITL